MVLLARKVLVDWGLLASEVVLAALMLLSAAVIHERWI